MQSLQMRWPVPGSIGLSMTIIASAAIESPPFCSTCISPIFSSSGQPSSAMPSGFFLARPACRACPSSTSPSRARGSTGSSRPRSGPRAATCARRSARKPSRRRRCSGGPSVTLGSFGSGRRSGTRSSWSTLCGAWNDTQPATAARADGSKRCTPAQRSKRSSNPRTAARSGAGGSSRRAQIAASRAAIAAGTASVVCPSATRR